MSGRCGFTRAVHVIEIVVPRRCYSICSTSAGNWWFHAANQLLPQRTSPLPVRGRAEQPPRSMSGTNRGAIDDALGLSRGCHSQARTMRTRRPIHRGPKGSPSLLIHDPGREHRIVIQVDDEIQIEVELATREQAETVLQLGKLTQTRAVARTIE